MSLQTTTTNTKLIASMPANSVINVKDTSRREKLGLYPQQNMAEWKVLERLKPDFIGWVLPQQRVGKAETSASTTASIVSLAPASASFAVALPTTGLEPIDTNTSRRVSLKEAARIARAIYHETKRREDNARELEAAYWSKLDDDY